MLVSADLSDVLSQPSQVVAAHLAPHVTESFCLSCLYLRVCGPAALIGKGGWRCWRRPSGVVVSLWPLHAGVVLYLLLVLFCGFLFGI